MKFICIDDYWLAPNQIVVQNQRKDMSSRSVVGHAGSWPKRVLHPELLQRLLSYWVDEQLLLRCPLKLRDAHAGYSVKPITLGEKVVWV